MITKSRNLPTYLGFTGTNKYWAQSGWYVGPDKPNWSIIPVGLSWMRYWEDYYSSDTLAALWAQFGASKASTSLGAPSHKNAYETITYETGPKHFNPCEHRSFKAISLPFVLAYGKQAVNGQPSILPFRRISPVITANPFTVVHLASSGAASSRAWYEMQPRFEGEINMVNFLLELSDIKNLLRHGYKILKKIRNLPKLAHEMLSAAKKKGVDPTRSAAELILEYNLGISPLVQDLLTIICQLCADVQDAQRMFQLKGELGTTRHYTESLAHQQSLSDPGSNGFYSTGTVQDTKFTATLHMHYDYQMRSACEAMLKFWGLTGSAEALWNAIPFSFVADYFLKIGQAIHRMETDPNVKVSNYRYCESIKTTVTVGRHFNPGPIWTHHKLWLDGSSSSSPVGSLICGYESKLYTRLPCSPNKGAALPQVHVPGGKQMLNMAALTRCFMS